MMYDMALQFQDQVDNDRLARGLQRTPLLSLDVAWLLIWRWLLVCVRSRRPQRYRGGRRLGGVFVRKLAAIDSSMCLTNDRLHSLSWARACWL